MPAPTSTTQDNQTAMTAASTDQEAITEESKKEDEQKKSEKKVKVAKKIVKVSKLSIAVSWVLYILHNQNWYNYPILDRSVWDGSRSRTLVVLSARAAVNFPVAEH